jgi:hypothetical protein
MLNAVMPNSVVTMRLYDACHYAQCHSVKYRYTECLYAECRSTRGFMLNVIILNSVVTTCLCDK